MLLHQPSVHLQEGATERRWHWQNSLVRLVTILTTKVRITASYYHATRYSIGLQKRIPRHHQKDWWVQRKFAKNCEGTAMRVSATGIPHTRTVTEGMYVCSYIRTYVCVYACMYVCLVRMHVVKHFFNLLTCKFSDFANPFLIFIFLSVAMVSRMLPSNALAMISKGHVGGRISTVWESPENVQDRYSTTC